MRTNVAVRRSRSKLLLVLWILGALATGPAVAGASGQQADQVVNEEGLKLTRHGDGTYELSADGVSLEELVGHLASMSGAEFSVAPELLHTVVTVETDRQDLSLLLDQLRAYLQANLILASTREHDISRVWLTPTSNTAPAADANVAGTAAASPAQNPGLQGASPPPGALPLPTGNEIRAAGFDPNVDMGEYIRSRNAAAANAAAVPGPGEEAAGPPDPAADPQATNAPPIPMDPNALENYFAGDGTTKTYHRLNCIQAMYLPAANKVWFKSRQEAIAAGYTPHDICVAR